MRRRLLLAAAVAAATITALLTTAASASADGTTVITAGPAQYTLGFTHPTGTLSVGGGTINARCTASSFVGSPLFGTPRCTTRKVTCPTTSTFCDLAINFQENALRGPVAFVAGASFVGSIGLVTQPEPYNCPGLYNCGWRINVGFMSPGTTVQLQIINFTKAGLPNVFAQATLTVN
jgi:hypothetical protein